MALTNSKPHSLVLQQHLVMLLEAEQRFAGVVDGTRVLTTVTTGKSFMWNPRRL